MRRGWNPGHARISPRALELNDSMGSPALLGGSWRETCSPNRVRCLVDTPGFDPGCSVLQTDAITRFARCPVASRRRLELLFLA